MSWLRLYQLAASSYPEALSKELLVLRLLLGDAGGGRLLDGLELAADGGVGGRELLGVLERLDGALLVLELDEGLALAEVGLGLVGVGDAPDGQGVGGGALGVLPRLELEVHHGRIVVEHEAELLDLGLGLVALVLGLGLLVDVAQALLVLVERERHVAALEGLVAEALAVRGDLEHLLRVQLLVGVLGEVLVGVAQGVGRLGVAAQGLGGRARQLAAVVDDAVARGLVAARGGHVLDLSDDGLAAADLAKDDVLSVEVGRRDGRYEELGAVGACKTQRLGQELKPCKV